MCCVCRVCMCVECICVCMREDGNQGSTLTLDPQLLPPKTNNKQNLRFNFFHVHVFMCGNMSMPRNTQDSLRTVLSYLWVPSIELREPGLVASAFYPSHCPHLVFLRQESLNGTWDLPGRPGWLAGEPRVAQRWYHKHAPPHLSFMWVLGAAGFSRLSNKCFSL